MTDQERARALSGATRECACNCHKEPRLDQLSSCEFEGCDGTGRVPLLDPKRARKACPYAWHNEDKSHFSDCPGGCHGDGWRSTLLEEPETCPDLTRFDLLHESEPGNPDQCRKCGGVGIVQAWRLQLLIDVLEGARVSVDYGRCLEGAHEGKCWYVETNHSAHDKRLAVAACEALRLVPETK